MFCEVLGQSVLLIHVDKIFDLTNSFTIKYYFQTYETPLHYVSRHGNDEILLEMLKSLHPDKVQSSVNRQDKVCYYLFYMFIIFCKWQTAVSVYQFVTSLSELFHMS